VLTAVVFYLRVCVQVVIFRYLVSNMYIVFFFKQKTTYEIS